MYTERKYHDNVLCLTYPFLDELHRSWWLDCSL